ncbi:MAG: type II toxin-antitoxin system VapC family toxin [Planctomycetota bacterium]
MNGYLLDTHVLLWWLAEPERLAAPARDIIEDPQIPVLVSAAAVWEMAVKKAIGRLDMPSNLPEVLAGERIEILDVGIHHALAVADLPMHHRDPFDRLQVVQARIENLVLVTRDRRLVRYEVQILGA